VAGGDPGGIVGQARDLVDVLRGLEEWERVPNWMLPVPMETLTDQQAAPRDSLVLLALVEKTGSTADRRGKPRYVDVLDYGLRPRPRIWRRSRPHMCRWSC